MDPAIVEEGEVEVRTGGSSKAAGMGTVSEAQESRWCKVVSFLKRIPGGVVVACQNGIMWCRQMVALSSTFDQTYNLFAPQTALKRCLFPFVLHF